MSPLVSIIIPTFNRAHLIGETLDSVLKQTYQNWECIIIDDGSTDSTIDSVRNFINVDNRFRFLIRPINRKKGASTCRNIGLENSRGHFIQFLDSDDVMSPDKIYEQVKILASQSELSFAFCKWGRFSHSTDDFDLYDSLIVYQDFSNPIELLNTLIVSKGYLPIHSFLFPKKLVDKAGLWDENLGLNDDGEFFSRIVVYFKNAFFTSNCNVLYRVSIGQNNLSAYKNEENVLKAIKSWEKIFKIYKKKFNGKEKKYRIYIKKVVYLNVKKYSPKHINQPFFFELKIYFWKERILSLLSIPFKRNK